MNTNLPQNYNDDNIIETVELPSVFDSVSGDSSYLARCGIRAALTNLKEYRNVQGFCEAVEQAFWIARGAANHPDPCFAVSQEDVRTFAVDFVASLPPEPETVAEQVQQYDLLPSPKPEAFVISLPVPPPAWINNLPPDDYVLTPMFGFQQQEIKRRLRSYCGHGSRSIALDDLKKSLRPERFKDFENWLSEIDYCRAEHTEKIQNKIAGIKEQFKKDAQQLATKFGGGELKDQMDKLKGKTKKLIEDVENDR